MRKTLAVALLILIPGSALAAQAIWTGKQKFVTTVTYKEAVSCEYDYLGTTFWRVFLTMRCPMTVEVE